MDVGDTLTRRGQLFTVVDVWPHVRRDGAVVSVRTLESNCRSCGAEFRTTAGPKALLNHSQYIARRCADCRAKRAARAKRPKCATCGRRLPEGRAG